MGEKNQKRAITFRLWHKSQELGKTFYLSKLLLQNVRHESLRTKLAQGCQQRIIPVCTLHRLVYRTGCREWIHIQYYFG
jgi:hypothetical protein